MKIRYSRISLFIGIYILTIYRGMACGFSYDPDYNYYNLFMQEIIEDKQYYPFLVTANLSFYETDKNQIKNENIEQWQEYLGISYEQAYYLVFKASEKSLRALLKEEEIKDLNLTFLTPSFVKKYKDAIEYLAYAKYLEPYMRVITDSRWSYGASQNVGELDYEKEIYNQKTQWKKVKDKDLKLRYGYQLVRLAHYSHKYEEAITFFDIYVESLDYRPAMYYHALSQKAGAERGTGNVSLANYHFLQVFVNSKNLKESAALSMQINEDMDWDELVEYAENLKELNDAYLLLGYKSFNNPLNEIKKIIANAPDAIQAKVLMVRAINRIERKDMYVYPWYWNYWFYQEKENKHTDKRYPLIVSLSDEIIELSDNMTKNPQVQDKNFWFLTSAYLHFLKKNFRIAKSYLDKVREVDDKYALQKENLALFIDISQHSFITPGLEILIYEKHKDFFINNPIHVKPEDYYYRVKTADFVKDVLANRYFLQKDYAKSFLLTNEVTKLEQNPKLGLVNRLEEFYRKRDKTPLERYIAGNFRVNDSSLGVDQYLEYIRGVIYLTQGNLSKSHAAFQRSGEDIYKIRIPKYVFGVNIKEWMSCDPGELMTMDYITDFPFIKEKMNFEELTQILLQLEEIGRKNEPLASKANYLLGNFFYNVSVSGYYRNLLRFNESNGADYLKYNSPGKPDIYNNIYFKYYQNYYDNTYLLSEKYQQLAYGKATDKELKAHIVFALSKCEQEKHDEERTEYISYDSYRRGDHILITDRKYFKELMEYQNTAYFKKVESSCKYFEYYVNNVFK